MVSGQNTCSIQNYATLGTLPPKCRSVELHVSPIMPIDLVRKDKGNPSAYRVRTLMDSGAGTNWCHVDLLKHVQYNNLGTTTMQVQVFEGCVKKSYKYVEIFYTVQGKIGTLKCFVTNHYAWFNEVQGLFHYASNLLSAETVIDPSLPCDHDLGKKEIALILGPYASHKLRDRNVAYHYEGNLLFESYKLGNKSGFVFSGLLPKHLNTGVIYSYRMTPMIEEHLDAHGLRHGEIDFVPDLCQDRYDLLQNLEFLWSKETLGVKPHEYKQTDQIAIQKFYDSVKWDEDNGKYSVGLPLNDRIERLKENKEIAYARLFQLIRKFVQNPKFAVKYAMTINEYIEKFAEEVTDDTETSGPICYLPHREVIREESSTTKFRIVFDASAKSGRDEVSLNDCLMQGPNLVQQINACLINFRTGKHAFSADLQQAFLQMLIRVVNRDILRFLFPSDPLNPLSPIKVYRFKVVIFGANCSPFLLAAVITKHFQTHVHDKYLRDTLHRGLYVDNLFQRRNAASQLLQLFLTCRSLFAYASMNLRSWRSDLPELNDLAKEHDVLEESKEIKVLGLLWDTETSTMRLRDHQKWNGQHNKQAVLSYANQYYDPTGIMVPVEIGMRLFVQDLWSLGYKWRDSFENDSTLVHGWDVLRAEAQTAVTKILPRSVCNAEEGDLHVFCDASKYVYGAVTYIVSAENSSLVPEMVMGKAKIVGKDKAPKVDTMPKLELMALVMGSFLAKYCIEALFHVKINNLFLWSDSKTALSWCSSYDVKEDFVSNRVRQIRSNVPHAKLMYVRSAVNPADILTRPPKATEFLVNSLWWHGPDFLVNPGDWPVQVDSFNLMPEETMKKEFCERGLFNRLEKGPDDQVERPDLIQASKAPKGAVIPESHCIVGAMHVTAQQGSDDELESLYSFEGFGSVTPNVPTEKVTIPAIRPQCFTLEVNWKRFNSYLDLLRSYARVFLAIELFKLKLKPEHLIPFCEANMKPMHATHFVRAKRFLLQRMQQECFQDELNTLRKGKAVKKGPCRLFRLYLDVHGTIRCRARTSDSPDLKAVNGPVLFGTTHKFTQLLLWYIHDFNNCPGYSYAMHRVKKDMYFPKFKGTLRKTLNECAKCKLHKSRAYAYPGNPPLPAYRTEATTPFEFCGLDYAGPFEIDSHDFGGHMWICLFTCLVTRACHLVMVPKCSTTAFLDALKDLSTFYRMPTLFLSDNATQFHAADRLLRQLQSSKIVQDTFGTREITWHFTPARASWVGGVFERMIGILKVELRKMSFGTKLTLQEARVHILEVQRIINSRPLTRATASLDDDTCITPMDLIRGYREDATILPEVYLEEKLEDLFERKQNLPQQYLRKKTNREKFFKNLNDGYFELLRFSSPGAPQKQGQGQTHRPPRVGDVVQIKQDTIRSNWQKGIIVELLVSSDGEIRRAKVMNNKKHVLERAICDLYCLELDAENAIPPFLDKRLHLELDDHDVQTSEKSVEVCDVPQKRLAAVAGRAITSEMFDEGLG